MIDGNHAVDNRMTFRALLVVTKNKENLYRVLKYYFTLNAMK